MISVFETATDIQDRIRNAARQRRISLDMTQIALADESGVPLGTLKRFERTGEISLASLLALAETLDALGAFVELFPAVEASTLDELEESAKPRQRVRSKRQQK